MRLRPYSRGLPLALCLLLLACSSEHGRSQASSTATPAALTRAGAVSAPTATAVTPLVVDDAASVDPTLLPVNVAGLPASIGPQTLSLPPGFAVSVVASGLAEPRFMAFDAAGNLIAGSNSGAVYRLPATANGGFGAAVPILNGLKAPHSVAFFNGYLYVGETDRVTRYSYSGDGTLGAAETVISDLPLVGEHFTRTIVFGPDGQLYVGVGSSCNICQEQDPRRAAISRYNSDGSGWTRYAWGTRNAVGLAFEPGTGQLWAAVNERDYQGNEVPPDYVTRVDQGDNFGWPDCQPPNAMPQDPGDDCSGVTMPSVAIQAHAAPLGIAFYSGGQFPADYQGDAIVAEHGSWNRQPPAPPQLVRIHFQNGVPVSVRDFATGWQTDSGGTRWGRPTGVIVAPDGSLIVSDDTRGLIYRISHGG